MFFECFPLSTWKTESPSSTAPLKTSIWVFYCLNLLLMSVTLPLLLNLKVRKQVNTLYSNVFELDFFLLKKSKHLQILLLTRKLVPKVKKKPFIIQKI